MPSGVISGPGIVCGRDFASPLFGSSRNAFSPTKRCVTTQIMAAEEIEIYRILQDFAGRAISRHILSST